MFGCIDQLLGLRVWRQIWIQAAQSRIQGDSSDALERPLVNLVVKVIRQLHVAVSQHLAAGYEIIGYLLNGLAEAADGGQLQHRLLDTRAKLSPGLSVTEMDSEGGGDKNITISALLYYLIFCARSS